VGADARSGRLRRWRWVVLATAAAGCAIAIAWLVVALVPPTGERARLKAVIGEVAGRASPDSAALLYEAGTVMDRVLRQFPNSAETLHAVASFYEGLGRSKDAVRCWEAVVNLDSSAGPVAHAAMGAIAYRSGELDLAAEHYRLAMQQDPNVTAHSVRLAEVLLDQGRPQEAVELLEGLLKSRPRLMAASVFLGQAYLRLQQYDKARQHLETGVALGPDYPNAYFGLATACARLGDQAKAKEYMQKYKELQAQAEQRHRDALKNTSDVGHVIDVVARAHTGASKVYIAHGDYHAAERCLRRAGEVNANDLESRVLLAWLHEQQGRADDALAILAELRQQAPDDLGTQMSLGEAYARLGRAQEAEAAYRRAIELAPQQAGGYAALAHFYLQANRKTDQARTLAEKAVEVEPVAAHYFLLCLARSRNGDTAGAASAIDRAVALDPDNGNYRKLARTLRSQPPQPPSDRSGRERLP
jgi:tetratricopeptide (TPR) repeat protein